MEIGENMIAGMAIGVTDKGNAVSKSIEGVASDVVDTASSMLSKVPDMLGDLTDIDPVITPVLDLSQVEKDAKKLCELSNVIPITAAASFDRPRYIQPSSKRLRQAEAAASKEFNFEQNNYSPESLSDIEIYRQTRTSWHKSSRPWYRRSRSSKAPGGSFLSTSGGIRAQLRKEF